MSDIWTAAAATLGALGLAYLNGFIATKHRRHYDGSAIAAGLAGELSAYEEPVRTLSVALDMIESAIKEGHRANLKPMPIDRPKDVFYEAVVKDLGLLGADLVENVVFVYSNINAFRTVWIQLTDGFTELNDMQLLARVMVARDSLSRAEQRGRVLVPMLKERAKASYLPIWAWTGR